MKQERIKTLICTALAVLACFVCVHGDANAEHSEKQKRFRAENFTWFIDTENFENLDVGKSLYFTNERVVSVKECEDRYMIEIPRYLTNLYTSDGKWIRRMIFPMNMQVIITKRTSNYNAQSDDLKKKIGPRKPYWEVLLPGQTLTDSYVTHYEPIYSFKDEYPQTVYIKYPLVTMSLDGVDNIWVKPIESITLVNVPTIVTEELYDSDVAGVRKDNKINKDWDYMIFHVVKK